MDLALNASTFSALFGSVGLAASALVLLALLLTWSSTGSFHILRHRIWQLASGKRQIKDPAIRSYEEGQSDLMSFRAITGLHVRSLEGARELIALASENGWDLEKLSAAGPFFDCDQRVLKKIPAKKWIFFHLMLAIASGGAACGALALCISNSAYLRFTESGTWFALAPSSASALSWPRSKSSLDRFFCGNAATRAKQVGTFSLKEVNELCSAFNNAETKGYIDRTVQAQRSWGGILLVLSAFLAWENWRSLLQGVRVKRLASMLKPKVAPEIDASVGQG